MLKNKRNSVEKQTFLITQPENKHSKIDFKEVYRHIRTGIEYSTVGQNVKAINVTSSIPGESKSTTSINLAMIYATKYDNVLLIDCDLRKSTIHRYLKLSNSRGLTNALMEYDESKKISSKYFQFYEDEQANNNPGCGAVRRHESGDGQRRSERRDAFLGKDDKTRLGSCEPFELHAERICARAAIRDFRRTGEDRHHHAYCSHVQCGALS